MLTDTALPKTGLEATSLLVLESETFIEPKLTGGTEYRYFTLSQVEDENRGLSAAHKPLVLITNTILSYVY